MSLIIMLWVVILITVLTIGIVVFEKLSKMSFVNKSSDITLTIYVAVLFVCLIAYFILSKPEWEAANVTSDKQHYAQMNDVKSALHKGDVDQVKNNLINEQLFNYEGEVLYLEQVEGDNNWFSILIERKSENDGVIEVKQYNTGTTLNNINVTDKVKPFRLNVEGEVLRVMDAEPTTIHFTFYKKEFPISQFTEEKESNHEYGTNSYMGADVIYLRIPNDVLVKNETNVPVDYVEK